MLNASYAATEKLTSSMKKPETDPASPDGPISEELFDSWHRDRTA